MNPTPKVVAGGAGGAITIIVVWVLSLVGVDMPAVVASAVTTVASFGAGYFTKTPQPPEGNAP